MYDHAHAQERRRPVIPTIRLFLLLGGFSFFAASLAHLGVLVQGYEHEGAYIPESIIGAVLLAGFALTFVLPSRARAVGIAAQSIALMGSLIGLYVSVIGIGPHTVPDLVFHVGIVLALLWGLVVAARGGSTRGGARLASVTVVRVLIRATGLLQVALGLAFWSGNLRVALPFHIFNGILFVLLLLAQTGLAAWAGVKWQLVLFALVWAVLVPTFGMTHPAMLPGDLHRIVELVHMLVGLVAIGLGERLASAARARFQGTGPRQPTQEAAGLAYAVLR